MEKVLRKACLAGLMLISTLVYSQNLDTIQGKVLYHNEDGQGMAGVKAVLVNVNGDKIDSTYTNGDGNYDFLTVPTGTYTINFSSTQPPANINIIDPFIVMMHLNELVSLNEIEQLAADVDGDHSVSWIDYNLIVANINQGTPFPAGDWVFENATYIPENRTGGPIGSGGSSVGDANGTYIPTKSGNNIACLSSDEEVIMGSEETKPLQLTSLNPLIIGGMNLVLDIPEGLIISRIDCTLEDYKLHVTGNQLRITWLDKDRKGFVMDSDHPLITIFATADNFSSQVTKCSFRINGESQFIDLYGEDIAGIQLSIPSVTLKMQEPASLRIYPNPFFDGATIGIQLPGDGNISVKLYDATGRLVSEIENKLFQAGYHEIFIDGSLLNAGMYLYSVSFIGNVNQDNFVKTGSIIKSK
jgi:hypothetical protein